MNGTGPASTMSRIVRVRATRIAVVMVIVEVASAAVALAADARQGDSSDSPTAEERPLLFELAAFGGLGVGGNFALAGGNGTGTGDSVGLADHSAFALAADLKADEARQYELFFSREATNLDGNAVPHMDVTIEYLHIGGLLLDDEPKIKPYLVGGVGITRLTPGDEGSTDTRFSASLGLGLRWPVTRHFSIRLEGRGFATLVNPDAAVFCSSDQAGLLCRIHGHGRTFLQGQFLAGAAFVF